MAAIAGMQWSGTQGFRWRTIPFAVLTIGILALAAALYLIVVELEADSLSNQTRNRDNLAWNAVQIERELAALIVELDSYYLNEPETSKQRLIDRFDVFWSRVHGIEAGAFAKTFMSFDGVATLIDESKQTLLDVEPAIQSLMPGDAPSHDTIKRKLQKLLAPFHRLSLLALHRQSREASEVYQRIQDANAHILMIFAGVLGGSAILIGFLLRERRHVNELHASLERRVVERTRELQQEIAQRRQAEVELRESRDRIRLIADNLPVLIAYFDTESKYRFVNDTLTQWYARTANEIHGRTMAEILGLHNYQRIKPRLDAALTGVPQCCEQIVDYPDGKTRVIELNYVPHFDETGDVLGCFALIQDITERKHADEKIYELNAELEQRVEDRTAELRSAQESLLRKERLAVLGQLTGTVAHEIRNPLSAIATSASVIQHKCSGAELGLERALDRVFSNIKRCDTIVTELLDFARARGLQPEFAVLDAWLLGVLEEQSLPENVTLCFDRQTDGAVIAFDQEELRRAVINVVDNACQAMAEGRSEGEHARAGTLSVATGINGGRVEIVISDTGAGIPEAVLPQVLEPLFSTKPFGTGLGLPTVQRILEDHDGGLQISNAEGGGVEATLWLPLAEVSEERRSA